MSIRDSLLPELEHEFATTRKLLEIVPESKTSFRPHAKSWTMGELSLHVANVLTWLPLTLNPSDRIHGLFWPVTETARTRMTTPGSTNATSNCDGSRRRRTSRPCGSSTYRGPAATRLVPRSRLRDFAQSARLHF